MNIEQGVEGVEKGVSDKKHGVDSMEQGVTGCKQTDVGTNKDQCLVLAATKRKDKHDIIYSQINSTRGSVIQITLKEASTASKETIAVCVFAFQRDVEHILSLEKNALVKDKNHSTQGESKLMACQKNDNQAQ